LLPPTSQPSGSGVGRVPRRRHARFLYGILGAGDSTLVPFVQPGAVVEINTEVRTVEQGRVFNSIFERPVYFLRSHDGYHCGWCELDATGNWLTLVPSAVAAAPHRKWRYRQEVEVIGLVNRVLTRLGFPANPAPSVSRLPRIQF
jgi:hypothetical protein